MGKTSQEAISEHLRPDRQIERGLIFGFGEFRRIEHGCHYRANYTLLRPEASYQPYTNPSDPELSTALRLHGAVEGLSGRRGGFVIFDEAGGRRGVGGAVGPSAGH